MHKRIYIWLEILCWYLWYLVTRGSVLHQSCYYRETLQTYSLQIHSPLALVIFLRFISNILAIFVQWKGVTIRLNHDYISSPHDVTAGNHYFFLATSLSKWVLSKEGLFYKKKPGNLSLVIPVNTCVCFVISFADRLYLRCDIKSFFSLKINENLHQANVQKSVKCFSLSSLISF